MKNNLRKLRVLARMLDLDEFYSVTIHEGDIELQGKYNSRLVVRLKKEFKFIDGGICRMNGCRVDDPETCACSLHKSMRRKY